MASGEPQPFQPPVPDAADRTEPAPAPAPGGPRAAPAQTLPRVAMTYWRLQGSAAAIGAAAIAAGALGPLWGLLVLGVGLAAALVAPGVLWRRWRYEVRPEELDLRHGLLVTRRTLVPMRRVQHVDTETGPLQGLFDLASVSVHTAAGSTTIPALLRGDAEELRRRVSALARARDDV